jgi:hypothetical protein
MTDCGICFGKKALIHVHILLVNAFLMAFKSGLVKKRENTQTALIILKRYSGTLEL